MACLVYTPWVPLARRHVWCQPGFPTWAITVSFYDPCPGYSHSSGHQHHPDLDSSSNSLSPLRAAGWPFFLTHRLGHCPAQSPQWISSTLLWEATKVPSPRYLASPQAVTSPAPSSYVPLLSKPAFRSLSLWSVSQMLKHLVWGFNPLLLREMFCFDDPPSQLWVPEPGVEFGERLGLYLSSHFNMPSLSFLWWDGSAPSQSFLK